MLYALVHNSNLLTGPRRSVLNWHKWGLPPWSSEFQIRPLPFLPIQYSPLFANCPPGLILNHSINYSSSQHSIHEPGYKKALNLMSATCHSTSTKVLSAKHSTTNGYSTMIVSRWYTKGIMLSRVSSNSYNINAQVNNNLRIVVK
jgi:hypothetical protein